MNIKKILLLIILLALSKYAISQITDEQKDSIYIQQVEDYKEPDKVLHAEPLYIDLIRDLGARKGEKEWNIGIGLTDNLQFDSYTYLIEYEWAPIDRLGLEVELPFTFYSPLDGIGKDSVPSSQLNSLKIAVQWSLLVNEPIATSLALGYINEFELSNFNNFGNPLIKGNIYNPFLVVAKRWGNNFHSLIYTGPVIEQNFRSSRFYSSYHINTSFHYMISGTRNFVGMEFNKIIDNKNFKTIIRPQMRLGVADNLLVGIVVGIPTSRKNERFSSFVRVIWEPGHKKK